MTCGPVSLAVGALTVYTSVRGSETPESAVVQQNGLPNMKNGWSRRSFLNAAVNGPLLLSVSYAGVGVRLAHALADAGEVLDARESRVLERVVYHLIPFPEVGAAPYRNAVLKLAGLLQQQPDTLALVRSGIGRLEERAGTGGWEALAEDAQIAVLERLEEDPFFQFMHRFAFGEIYNDPLVWKRIGYGGSSMEFGGYLERGFNDIDWL